MRDSARTVGERLRLRLIALALVGLAALVMGPLPASADAASRPKAGTYRGKTSQGYRLTMKVSRGGRRVKLFVTSIDLTCGTATWSAKLRRRRT